MARIASLLAPAVLLAQGGCVAKTLVDVATLPVRATGQAADWATTSQDEADRERGREIRRREERLGELQRNDEACRRAVAVRREMNALAPAIPVEPD
jgi:hypothetical protein